MTDLDFDAYIPSIPDYPEPGVIFRDITPLFANADVLKAAIDEIAGHFQGQGITKVVGPEARGFLVGAPVAIALGAGFIPARKPGKLPRKTISETYELEYGTDTIEIHADALEPGDKVLLLTYTGKSAGEPMVVALYERFHVRANIVFGNIDFIQGSALGKLGVVLSGEPEAVAAAQQYLKDNGVVIEEIS